MAMSAGRSPRPIGATGGALPRPAATTRFGVRGRRRRRPRGVVAVAAALLMVVGGAAPSVAAAPSAGLTELRHAAGKPVGEVLAVIRKGEWHPAAKLAPFGGHTDADGRIHLTFAPKDADLAATVQSALGERVVLRTGELALFAGGRMNDGSQHYGGAWIGATFPSDTPCTSGFTLEYPDGARGSVTAGHCIRPEDRDSEVFLQSGSQNYGLTDPGAAIIGSYPFYDMVAIKPVPLPTERFTNKIYTDPGAPVERSVVGAANPQVNSLVCVSGQATKAKCDVRVTALDGFWCHLEGLIGCVEGTNDLIVMSKPNVVTAFSGDSGGPVYTRTGSTGATINGMVVAGEILRDAFGNPRPKPGGLVYAEKISNIQFNFNARVATTP